MDESREIRDSWVPTPDEKPPPRIGSAWRFRTQESRNLLPSNVPDHPFFLVNPGFLFRKSTATAMLAAWLIVILWLTLAIFPNPDAKVNLIPFRSITHDLYRLDHDFVLNFLGNLAAFIPLGFFLPFARTSRTSVGLVVALGVTISSMIEVAQYVSGQRVCDVDDILLNTLSAVAGHQLAMLWIAREWKRSAARSSKLGT